MFGLFYSRTESICSLSFAERARAVDFGSAKKRITGDPLSPRVTPKRNSASGRSPPTSPPHASVISPSRVLPPSAGRIGPFSSGKRNARTMEAATAVEGPQALRRLAKSEQKQPLLSNPSSDKSTPTMAAAVPLSKTISVQASGRYSNLYSPEPAEVMPSLRTALLLEVQECASPNPMITPTPAKLMVTEADLERENSSSAKRQLIFLETEETWKEKTHLKGGFKASAVMSFSKIGAALAEELESVAGESTGVDTEDDNFLIDNEKFTLESATNEDVQQKPIAAVDKQARAVEEVKVVNAAKRDRESEAKHGEEAVKGATLQEGSWEVESKTNMADSCDGVSFEGGQLDFSQARVKHSPISTVAASASVSGSPDKSGRPSVNAMGASTTSSQRRKKQHADDGEELFVDSEGSPIKVALRDRSIVSPVNPRKVGSATKLPITSKVATERKVSFKADGNSLLKSI